MLNAVEYRSKANWWCNAMAVSLIIVGFYAVFALPVGLIAMFAFNNDVPIAWIAGIAMVGVFEMFFCAMMMFLNDVLADRV